MAVSISARRLCLVCFVATCLPLAGFAEIYKWVDSRGQVHFSDKRHAHDEAKRIDLDPAQGGQNANQFLFYPEADVLLNQQARQPLGETTALSAGNWDHDGVNYQSVSLLRFDISPLLAELNQRPDKKMLSATLRLFANTTDNLYGQGTGNQALPGQQPPGHSTEGDNAFYLKPVHNNFVENTVTWEEFFKKTHYTPNTIRGLPGTAVPGSETNNQKDYEIDLLPLLEKLMAANLRQFTLEMRLQRSGRAQVTFYSREAESTKRPSLQVDLAAADGNGEAQP